MFSKFVYVILGLPFALLCCLLAPIIYITVIAVSPLGLIYRHFVKPLLTKGRQAGEDSVMAHHPTA